MHRRLNLPHFGPAGEGRAQTVPQTDEVEMPFRAIGNEEESGALRGPAHGFDPQISSTELLRTQYIGHTAGGQ